MQKNKISHFRKNTKKGSSLFEFVVYMAIGLVLLYVGSLWVQHAYVPFSRSAQNIATLSSISSGLTVLKHDLYGAPCIEACWKKIAAHELIWAVRATGGGTSFGMAESESASAEVADAAGPSIGWRYQDGELVRIEGQYAAETQTWAQATTSVVAQQIEQLSFDVSYSHTENSQARAISSIKIEYVVDVTSYTQFFALRDRVFVGSKLHE